MLGGLHADRRGSAELIIVIVWIVVMVFALYVFAIAGPSAIEPLHDFAQDNDAVEAANHSETVSDYQSTSLWYGPALLAVGSLLLLLVYVVFRERFSGPRRPP